VGKAPANPNRAHEAKARPHPRPPRPASSSRPSPFPFPPSPLASAPSISLTAAPAPAYTITLREALATACAEPTILDGPTGPAAPRDCLKNGTGSRTCAVIRELFDAGSVPVPFFKQPFRLQAAPRLRQIVSSDDSLRNRGNTAPAGHPHGLIFPGKIFYPLPGLFFFFSFPFFPLKEVPQWKERESEGLPSSSCWW
jgi:hypothetical protein